MRLSTRAFLWSFIPFSVLLAASFWVVQNLAVSAIREGLRRSVQQSQSSISAMRAKAAQRNQRAIRIVAENPALKAGIQNLIANRDDPEARPTVEDQLAEIGSETGFELLVVSDPDSKPLAGVLKANGQITPLDFKSIPPDEHPSRSGYFTWLGQTYQVASEPVNQNTENLAMLSVGEAVDLSELPIGAILVHGGRIVQTNLPGLPAAAIETAFQRCGPSGECEMRLGGENYWSVPMEDGEAGAGYSLRSLQSLDAATRPVSAAIRGAFLLAGLGALLAAMLLSGISSRGLVRPISELIAKLRDSENTGRLPHFESRTERIAEIRDLADGFNRAGDAIREGQARLIEANVQFVESLANALDARDPYTAGHSRRVSEYACAIATAMQVSEKELAEIRTGALLHDIGKIGISDAVLLKPGRLTVEEEALIRQHPSIGRKILESVHGLQPFIAVVELHHENWDGSGYPHGLVKEQTPLTARIVKVADAYDAMTSDRVYRKGMGHQDALEVLRRISDTQVDRRVVEALCGLPALAVPALAAAASSLNRLAEAVEATVSSASQARENVTEEAAG